MCSAITCLQQRRKKVKFLCFAMFGLFLEFGARTRPQDLWPFSSPKPCRNFSHEPKAKFVSVTGLMWRGPEATSAEIQYWWHVITQIWLVLLIGRVTKEIASTNQRHYSELGSDMSSVRNFWARFSDFPWRENKRWCREISAVFSG